MDDSRIQTITVVEGNKSRVMDQILVVEEPLAIRINGSPYSVVMRTPGNEIYHAAGFCLGEGLVDQPEDFSTIGFCTEDGVNVVTATLTSERSDDVASLLKRKGFVSQTSCGICGKELIRDLYQILKPVTQDMAITGNELMACVDLLTTRQALYEKTHATHAAMLLDDLGNIVSSAEDVGRHNALDKAVGEAFMNKKLYRARLAVLSSRVSFEMVQKAARAGIGFIAGLSRPTALAVEMGQELNMTITCVRRDQILIFCGQHRINRSHLKKKVLVQDQGGRKI